MKGQSIVKLTSLILALSCCRVSAQVPDTTKMLSLARKLDSQGRSSDAVKLYDRILSQNMNSVPLLYESIEV